jgi:hypothetical protein
MDGSFTYSPIRPVVFSDDIQWTLYPNPSSGIFNLVYQLNDGLSLSLKIYDASGRTIKTYSAIGTGFQQKLIVDLQDSKIPSGLYMLEAGAGERKQYFKLLKQ